MDASYAITVKILDVSTGRFSHSADAFMGGDASALYTGIRSLVSAFAAGIGFSEGQVVQNTQSGRQSGKYKVGDTGPGGGTVFYVEGNFGSEMSRLLGEYSWSEAKTEARNYKGGGHSDWYLPTSSELNLIYENLQKAGVMNLGSDWYWSFSEYKEYKDSYSWGQRFSDGYQNGIAKRLACSVRSVWAF
ncbi:MAG: DUF1566 domain-containing protein, partial [Treponema sp.]|jgi:hypothetical protein|nr:DUF1566 domain-containing protein [Treponema sp.]